MTEARYVPGGDNSVLRDALYEAWGRRCHVCERPKAFHEIQIDHLIAHTVTDDDLRRLTRDHGLPDDFDLHLPANLAPACGDCNGQKGVHVLAPALLDIRLGKAARRAPRVRATVQSSATLHRIGRSLRALRGLDLTDPAARAAFEEHAPAVVQELALLDETKADYLVTRRIGVAFDCPDLAVDAVLDARGRAGVAMIEQIGGCTLAAAVGPAVGELAGQVRGHARDGLEAPDVERSPAAEGGALTVAELDCTYLALLIETVAVERDGANLYATLGGRFRCGFRGSVVRSVPAGGREKWHGEVGTAGGLRITCGWDLTAGTGSPRTRNVEITGWDHVKALVWTFRPQLLDAR
ncbi:HNH endonuclease [Actinoplanes sp. NPDC051494]|uniref:HNH endonuclease n=1 Tax=Actinoplanes sp. NPDC051494 TaxID=3363907 RepID=UPI003797F406